MKRLTSRVVVRVTRDKISEAESEKGLLEQVPSIVALVGALAVLLSFFRELGYFWVLDSKLLSLMTLQDMIENSLMNVPVAIGAILFIAFIRQTPAKGSGPAWLRSGVDFLIRNAELFSLLAIVTTYVAVAISTRPNSTVILFSFLWAPGVIALAFKVTAKTSFKYMLEIGMTFIYCEAMFFVGSSTAELLPTTPGYIVHSDTGDIEISLGAVSSDFFIGRDASAVRRLRCRVAAVR